MNNDLISRSEAEKLGATCLARRNENGQLEAIISLDNAPTVDLDERDNDAFETGYIKGLCENRPQGEWIPVSERLPEEKLSGCGFDFEEVLCTTIWGDVRSYKFGKPKGHDKPHFWLCGTIMDVYVIAWQYKPEPYKKGGAE